ncbi:HNH endonuclease signature motif containing protein [Pseudomonas aeruginosa]
MEQNITAELLRGLLFYCPENGSFTWLQRPARLFSSETNWKRWNTCYAGKRAGSVCTTPEGYKRRIIGIFGKIYLEHRLAWLYMTGEWPEEQIDHINQISTDNRWSNIRPATHTENARNAPKRKDNSSGITGVGLHKASGRWRARVNLSGSSIFLGYFKEKRDAELAVTNFRIKHGYTSLHGTERN